MFFRSMRRQIVVVVLALAGGGGVMAVIGATPAMAATTPGCSLAPTNGLATVDVGSRQYQLYVPPGLTGSSVPLLVTLHGAGSNGLEDSLSTDWDSFAASNNFIVAYPDASFPDVSDAPYLYGGVWDPYTTGSIDEAFIQQVVSNIESTYCIDTDRVYADGWSNGAVMSQREACNAANIFAAADSYAGGDPTIYYQYDAPTEELENLGFPVSNFDGAPCQPSRPISVSLIVGQEDFTYPALSEDASLWEGIDDCSSTPVAESDQYGSQDTYNCADGSQVFTRVVDDTSHNWPAGAQGDDQRRRIWQFFMAHPL